MNLISVLDKNGENFLRVLEICSPFQSQLRGIEMCTIYRQSRCRPSLGQSYKPKLCKNITGYANGHRLQISPLP
jgi:hypothetical protein